MTTGGGISGTIPDQAGGGLYVGATPPGSSLTNKVWFKTDNAGRPLGIYEFYNGNWRKVYTGVAPGEIRTFSGSNAEFDGTGLGLIGGDLDGWALCNGNNGTPNLTGYFLAGGEWGTGVGQGAGWYTNANGLAWLAAGGNRGITLTTGMLPNLNTINWYRSMGSGTGAQQPVVMADYNGTEVRAPVVDQTTGQPGTSQPLPTPILYYAVAFIEFVGYA